MISISTPKTSRQADLTIGLLFLLLAASMYHRCLLDGRVLYFRDFQLFYIPMKHFLAEAMRHGEWAFWNPHVLMGSPFLADPQAGVLYPPSLLLLLATGPTAVLLSLIFHLTVAQCGLYALMRHHGQKRWGAVAGALVYGLGGWMISAGNVMTELHSAAWVPWTVLAFERLWERPGRQRAAVAGAALAMQMLSGWPEMIIMLGLILLVRRLALPGLGSARWLLGSLVASMLAALIFAPQLLATWEAYTHSVRVAGLSEAEMLEFSATPEQWRSWLLAPALSPDNWNILDLFPDGHVPLTLSVYIGPVAILLALLGLTCRSRLALSCVILIALGGFIALGAANPLAVALLKLSNRFRSPEKYLFLIHFAVALLAALGTNQLLPRIRAVGASRTMGLLLLGALCINLIGVNSRIDLSTQADHYEFAQRSDVQQMRAQPGRVYARSAAAEIHDEVRPLYAAFEAALVPNTGVMAGISYLNGISFLPLREQTLALRLVDGLPAGARLANRLSFFGTRYLISDDPSFADSASWNSVTEALTPRLWQLKQSAPLLGFPQAVVPLNDNAIHSVIDQVEFSSGQTVFVGADRRTSETRQTGVVSALAERPGRIEATVSSPTGGLLVLRQFAYPGWRASVDGRALEVIPVNRFFLGVDLPPGTHQVRFFFEPTHWRMGLTLASLGLASLVLLMLAGRKRKHPGDSPA